MKQDKRLTTPGYLWLSAAMALLLVTTAFAQEPGQGPPAAKVRVGEAGIETLQARVALVGRLREVRRSTAAAERQGRVVEAAVEEGDRVIGGETVLARIDDVLDRLEVASVEAQLAQARAGIAEAEAEAERTLRNLNYLRELGMGGTAPPKEVRDAADNHAAAQARLERARADVQVVEARLDLAREQLRRAVILAPFDGTVVRKLTEVGQWVQPGGAVVEIISSGPLDAVIDVPERIVNSVRPGDAMVVNVEAIGASVRGEVASVTPWAATAARTFPVKVRVNDGEGRLKAGMSVVAEVPTSEMRQMLTVPRDAVLRAGPRSVVWIARDNQAFSTPVRVLFGEGDRYAIELTGEGGPAALEPGTLVVIEGAERIFFPGQGLEIQASPAPSSGEGTE